MCIILLTIICISLYYNYKQYKETKRLNKCWDDVFNSKIDSEARWTELCHYYVERITELQLENTKLKEAQKPQNKKAKQ